MRPGRSLGRVTGERAGNGKVISFGLCPYLEDTYLCLPHLVLPNNPDKSTRHRHTRGHYTTYFGLIHHAAAWSNSNPLHQAPAAVALARRCPPAPPVHPARPRAPAPAATLDEASTANAALMFPSTLSPERCGRSSARRRRAATFAAALAGTVVAAVVVSGSRRLPAMG